MTAHGAIGVTLRAFCLAIAFLCGSMPPGFAVAAETVQFESATYLPTPYQVSQALKRGETAKPPPGQPLTGRLERPGGKGPFAAIVLLHGCGGIWRWDEFWSDRLARQGYVVLNVDSLGPRGKGSICGSGSSISGETRALDAHGAKTFLAGLPFVDAGRIAVFGMSHGGWATLHAVRSDTTSALGVKPFRAAIALYPWCGDPTELDAPLLILTGERDDWSPVARCRAFAAGTRGEVALTVYPNAHHAFDLPDLDLRQDGHVMRYDAEAADDAWRQIVAFLEKNL